MKIQISLCSYTQSDQSSTGDAKLWHAYSKDWSVYRDAQADPSLRWALMWFHRFCHASTHFVVSLSLPRTVNQQCFKWMEETMPLSELKSAKVLIQSEIASETIFSINGCNILNNVTCYRNFPKFSDRQIWENSAEPDQTVWSGSTLFAYPSASFGCITLRKSHLVQLLGWLQQIFCMPKYLGNLQYVVSIQVIMWK